MATNDVGIEVPSTTDAFDPDGDMRDMATSLIPRVVIPVANDTARDALTPSAGWLVNRLDTGNLERYDGTAWAAFGSAYRPAVTLITSFTSGYGANTFGFAASARVWPNEKVELQGGIRKDSGTMSGNVTIAVLPAAAWPTEVQEFTAAIGSTSPTPVVRLEITLAGELTAFMGSLTSAWVSLDGISFYTS